MPLSKPYPPTEIDYSDWDDLADNYAGKGGTVIVDIDGKGDYTDLQSAIDALPGTNAGMIVVKDGAYPLTKPIKIEDQEDLIIRGNGKATRFRIANSVLELVTLDAAAAQKFVQVNDGTTFEVGQLVAIQDDTHYEGNEIVAIVGDVLEMLNNLANIYEVADNGRVYTANDVFYVTGASKRIRITELMIDGNRLNQTFGRTGLYPAEHHGDGIRFSVTTENVMVDHCYLYSVICHAICSSAQGGRFAYNEGWDNGYDSINIEPNAEHSLIQSNYLHDTPAGGWNGIQLGYSTFVSGSMNAIGNIVVNARMGIAGQGGSLCNVSGNVILNCWENGIEFSRMNRFTVQGNLISGADDMTDMTGPAIHIENQCSIGDIVGNYLEQGQAEAIWAENGAYLTITGNTIRKFDKHGIKFSAVNGRDSTITGNTIVDCDAGNTNTYSGIAIEGDRVAIVGNRIDNCDKWGIHLAAASNDCLVCGNIVLAYGGPFTSGPILDEGTNNIITRARSAKEFHSKTTIAAGVTVYLAVHGQSGNENEVQIVLPWPCWIRNMKALSTVTPGAGKTFVYTLRIDGGDELLTCTTSNPDTTSEDLTNIVAYLVDEKLSLSVVTSPASAVTFHMVSVEIFLEEGNIFG